MGIAKAGVVAATISRLLPELERQVEQIDKLREVVETPLLHPERFVNLGIEPPKGVLLYGPPGTGKTLCARAVANRTDACFIRVIGSELVQKVIFLICSGFFYGAHV